MSAEGAEESMNEPLLGNAPLADTPFYFIYLGAVVLIVGLAIAFYFHKSKKGSSKEKGAAEGIVDSMSVAGADSAYLAATLSPDSSHLDILLAIATTPENIFLTQQSLDKIEAMKEERLKGKKGDTVSTSDADAKTTSAFDLDDGGWAEDDEDDEAAKKAKEEELLKEKAKQQLAEANGAMKLEGIDDGVLGQQWVENALKDVGQWPPKDLRFLTTNNYSYRGNLVAALDHPAIRRNLCYTQGRLNSMALNTHTDLLEASGKKLIDQTYFKGSMEYRQRVALLLEASLRIAVTMKSYRLAKTIVEAVSMFKIGIPDPVSPKTLAWFNSVMIKQYSAAGLPRLSITNLQIEPTIEGATDIATDETAAITLDMERVHAEAFTKVKVAMCQQQGIPPQIALQSYREGWWVLVRAKKVDGGSGPTVATPNNPLTELLQEADKIKFEKESEENRLLVAWPMIVQNMAQQSGKVKVQFKAPSAPGTYQIFLAVKSQEFLGADQNFELTLEVKDVKDVSREAVVESAETKKEN